MVLFMFFESREPRLRDPEAVPAVCRRLSWRILNAVRNRTPLYFPHRAAPEGQNFEQKSPGSVVEGEVFRRSMCSGALRRRVSASMGRAAHKRSTLHSSPLNDEHVFTVRPQLGEAVAR